MINLDLSVIVIMISVSFLSHHQSNIPYMYINGKQDAHFVTCSCNYYDAETS